MMRCRCVSGRESGGEWWEGAKTTHGSDEEQQGIMTRELVLGKNDKLIEHIKNVVEAML